MPVGTAAIQAFLPVAESPEQAVEILSKGALMNEREQTGDILGAQRESATRLNEARIREINERIVQLQKGKQGVDPEFVKTIRFMEERRKQPFSNEELDDLFRIQSGQQGRAGTQRATPTEGEFIAQQLPSARRAERQELKTKYRTDDELIIDLRQQYRTIYGNQQPQDGEELIFVLDPQGKRVRIKRKDLQRALQRGFKEFEG